MHERTGETATCDTPSSSARLQSALSKIDSGLELSIEDATTLYQEASLAQLGSLAHTLRFKHIPDPEVTYLIDRNINYTNVCNSDCSFCGFYRHNPRDPESYVNSREVIGAKIEEALELGATRILFQGGHNDELPFSYYTDIVSWIHTTYPAIEINAFSPSEIHQMHLVSGKSYLEILTLLQQAGMRGLPGGGAEILDDEIRKRVSPKKISADTWITVMDHAQSIGLTTTATMVIGFGETITHRLNHLTRIRNLHNKSVARGDKGFSAFISWTLQLSEDTSLGRSRHAQSYGASPTEYLRMTAISRLFLSTIVHHQASWPTLGGEIASIALNFGCDDIGSTMMEENVVSKAGALTQKKWSMSPEELRKHISSAGFIPVQRDTAFNKIRR
jgi:cyclic dehypoxanthinyl futalosine synthase